MSHRLCFSVVVVGLAFLANVRPAQAAEYRSVDEVMAVFSSEPTVSQVQGMALEYSKTDPRYVEAWLSASKNAAWLPEFQFTYDYDVDYDDDYTYTISDETTETTDDTVITGTDVGSGWSMEVRAKWRFDKLIMSSERIRVISETQDVVKLRDKVMEEVTRLYFERRRLQVDMLLNPGDFKAQLKNDMRLQELTAQLDAYTGGQFSRSLAK